MLDITQLLQASIAFDNALIDQRDLLVGPTNRLQHAVASADRALDRLLPPATDYSLRPGDAATAMGAPSATDFAATLTWFLLVSARLQWTHLVVMDEDTYQQLVNRPASEDYWTKEKLVLTIKHCLLESYLTHRQADFKHAWHLLLKLGLVDWGFDPATVQAAHQKLLATALDEGSEADKMR